MNKNFKVQAQGGFTLIELIVVIVILGILAATALPKFANLSGDARFAALNAAKGSMTSASAIVHGKILVSPTAVDATTTPNTLTLEGQKIEVAYGYPMASDNGILLAAGIDQKDFTKYTATGTNIPATIPTNGFVLVPASIAGTASAVNCYIAVTPATATAAPVIALGTNAKIDNCQ